MIGVLRSTVLKYGHCVECDPTDLRSGDDQIGVFRLGSFTVRLCDQHAGELVRALQRSLVLRGGES